MYKCVFAHNLMIYSHFVEFCCEDCDIRYCVYVIIFAIIPLSSIIGVELPPIHDVCVLLPGLIWWWHI